MHAPQADLIDILMQWQNAGIAVVTMMLINMGRKAFPDFMQRRWVMRLMPFSPMMVASGLVWLPVHDPRPALGERILLGLILGATSGWVFQLMRHTFSGLGERLAGMWASRHAQRRGIEEEGTIPPCADSDNEMSKPLDDTKDP